MTDPSAEARSLRRLLHKQAIEEVVLRYCRGIDRMDRALVAACYHPDASDSHGSFQGGVPAYLDWVWRLLERYDSTLHFIGNVLVEFPDAGSSGPSGAAGGTSGEREDALARCESYGIAFHRKAGGPPEHNLTTAFRYIDRFERRAGAWRIAERVATTEWVRVNDEAGEWPIKAGFLTGRRDREDPVYRPLATAGASGVGEGSDVE